MSEHLHETFIPGCFRCDLGLDEVGEDGRVVIRAGDLRALAAAREENGRLREGGTGLIAAERERQITEEGYTPEHDDIHSSGSLADAARAYCWASGSRNLRMPLSWPWSPDEWKPSDDPIRNLVKAGALIAAEIDRLQRAALAREATDEAPLVLEPVDPADIERLKAVWKLRHTGEPDFDFREATDAE